MNANQRPAMNESKVDVLHAIDQADVALGVAGLREDDIFRAELQAARVAVTELIAVNDRTVWHLAKAVEYIEKVYPNARQLDRGPILRNMRRWAENLRAALAACTPAKSEGR